VTSPADLGLAAEIRGFVEERRETLIRLCADLVAADSAQPVGDTTRPAAVLAGFLRAHGLHAELLAAVPEKPNLLSTVEGRAPGPHLVLNGHLDTLSPGDPADWTVPILDLGRRDGRLTGLGIGNMKAGVAALALAFVGLAEQRERWSGRLTLTAVADEVVFGPHGAAWLLDRRPDLLGDALINAEGPGFMGLAVAEKGLLWLEIEASAPPGQGMLSRRGSSPIARLAAIGSELDSWNEERAPPPAAMAAVAEHAGEHGLRLSVNLGRIEGGSFVSQVATRARAEVDVRIPPGLDAATVEARVDALARRYPDVTWRRIKGWNPSWTGPDAAVSRCVSAAAEGLRGAPPPPVVRLPASDAARWRARGVPSVCFGPQPTLASGVDDYVIEQDAVDCAAIYALAALSFLGGASRTEGA
jgi:succinyl-diaminopimelate desuccinylase